MHTAIDEATFHKFVVTSLRWRRRKEMVDEQEWRRQYSPMYNTLPASEGLFNVSTRETVRHGGEHLSAPQPFDLTTLRTTHRLLTVEDLTVGQKHLGAYLLCRNIAPPLKSQGTHTVVEDVDGTAVQVSLYNFLSPCLAAGCVSWAMSVGDVFIVVEPYFKIAKDGKRTVRCDNPSHLVLLDDDDPFLTDVSWAMGRRCPEELTLFDTSTMSVKHLAEEGKRHFKAKRYIQAATNYRQAYKLCRLAATRTDLETDAGTSGSTEEQMALLSNCGELMLRLGHYRLALRDMTKACKLNPQSAKALERRSRALLGLGLVGSSLEDVEKALELCSTSKTAALLKKDVTSRLSSSSNGCDFTRLLEGASSLRTCRSHENFGILLPDFRGPIEVRPSPGRGRGLFATRPIAAGSVVLAEKALGFVLQEDVERLSGTKWDLSFDVDAAAGRLHRPSDSELTWRLMESCCENGEVAEAVGSLFGGHESTEMTSDMRQRNAGRVDVQHTKGVIKYNSFQVDSLHKEKEVLNGPIEGEDEFPLEDDVKTTMQKFKSGAALWNLACLINHSCVPNCNWFTVADFVIVSAQQDIHNGEELTVSYVDVLSTYSARQKHCRSFDFQCTCLRCQRESRVSQQLNKLVADLESIENRHLDNASSSNLAANTARLEQITARLEKLLPLPSIHLSNALLKLAQAYQETGELFKAATTLARSLKVHCSPTSDSIEPKINHPRLPLLAFKAANLFDACGCMADGIFWRSVGDNLALTIFCKSRVLARYFYSGNELVEKMSNFATD